MSDTLPLFSQENVLSLLVFNEEYFLLVRNTVTPELFTFPYNKIVEKCIDYIDKYKQPPKDHVADLLEKELQGADAEKYREFLISVNQLKENLNSKFVVDSLTKFITGRRFSNAILDAANLHQKGKTEEAQELIQKALDTNLTIFDSGIKFTDYHILAKSLEEENVFPSGIRALDQMKVGPARGQVIVLLAKKGAGKAQPLTSQILTPTGWKLMGDMQVGDKITGVDGKPYNVLGVYPQGVKQTYKVTFSDNSSTKCCEDHLWECNIKSRIPRDKPVLVLSLKEIINNKLYYKSGQPKFYISQLQNSVEFINNNTYDISPYNLGLLLSDKLAQILKKLGLRYCNSGNKFIPNKYKYTSILNRIAILQGLLDSDGTPGHSHRVDYTSKSYQLAKDVQDIVRSLGGISSLEKSYKSCWYKGKKVTGLYWRCSISLPDNIQPFQLPYKKEIYDKSVYKNRFYKSIISIEKDQIEECQCITVDAPRGLYITDDYIVTHNSWNFVNNGKLCAFLGLKVAHITLEIDPEHVYQRYIQNALSLTRWQLGTIKLPMFVKDGNSNIIRVDQAIVNPKSLNDYNIIDYVEQGLKRIAPRMERNLRIKGFPSGQLTMPMLRAYLDGLEKVENFIPDIVILDQVINMNIPLRDFRLALNRTYMDLRGLAVERNFALITGHHINRIGAGAKITTGEHVSEDWGMLGVVDTALVYNQRPAEAKLGLARLFVDRGRTMKSGFWVLITQSYDSGHFALDSTLLESDFYNPDSGINGQETSEYMEPEISMVLDEDAGSEE